MCYLGEYWVDPNEGDVKDAILVKCDFESNATCVLPSPSKTSEIDYTGREQEVWLSEIDPDFKVCAILLIQCNLAYKLTFSEKKILNISENYIYSPVCGQKELSSNKNEVFQSFFKLLSTSISVFVM